MKKRILLMLTVCVALALALSSCQFPIGSQKEPEGFIFDADSDVTIVFADTTLTDELNDRVYNAVMAARGGNAPDFGSASLDPSKHEIVIGPSDRPISVAAYMRLEQMDNEDGDNLRYVIYSDGSSVAIAYDTDKYLTAAIAVLDVFISEYLENKDSLVLTAGVVTSKSFNVYEYYEATDNVNKEAQWAALYEYFGESGEDIVDALKVLYTNYDREVIEWLAGLYAPRVCVCDNYDENGNKVCLHPKDENGEYLCSGGGFYYSVSALENQGFLPDIESTAQALGIIDASGMSSVSGSIYKAMPDWMKNDLAAFIQPLQDKETGYFVHPQWSSNPSVLRRSRDLSNATKMLKNLGVSPWYKTPSGVEGSITDEPASYSYVTPKLSESVVTLVSHAISVASSSQIVISSPWLESDETFREYLSELDLSTNSYSIGSNLTVQTSVIIQRDKELKAEGANYSLMDIVIDWLNENQDPNTGHWHAAGTNYSALNGVLKVLGVYQAAHAPIPYADVLAASCIEVINSTDEPGPVTELYNPWGGLTKVLANIRNYAPPLDENGRTPEERIADILEQIYAVAPEAILRTSERVAKYRKADGGFSYRLATSSEISLGEKAAMANMPEGDVNGTALATTGLLSNIYQALGIGSYMVDIYGHADLIYFFDIIEDAGPIYKAPIEVKIPDPITFDEDTEGEKPNGVGSSIQSKNGEAYVVADPREGATGNVLYFNSPNDSASAGGNGKPDAITLSNQAKISNANALIFAADLCFIGECTPNGAGYTTQLEIGLAYALTFRIDSEGKIHIWESSSTEDKYSRNVELKTVELNEWFNVKVEVYTGDEETVRIKVYINGELITVSNNYYDVSGNKLSGKGAPSSTYNQAVIRVISSRTTGMYIDNITAYNTTINYTKPDGTENLVFNADAEDQLSKTYTFDEAPEDINASGDFDFDGGVLHIDSNGSAAKLDIPVHLRQALGNAVDISMELCVDSADLGTVATLTLREANSNIESNVSTTYRLVMKEIGGEAVISFDAVSGSEIESLKTVAIPIGEWVELRLVYFRDEGMTLVYVEDVLVAATAKQSASAKNYTPSILRIETSASVDSEITIDNLKVERKNLDFETATKPENDRVINDFESGMGDITANGATVIENNGDKLLEIKYTDDIALDINKLSNFAPVTVFKAQMTVTNRGVGTGAVSHIIVFEDEDGNEVFSLGVVIIGTKAELHECIDGVTLGSHVASFELGAEVEITVEYYSLEMEMQVSVGTTVTGVTNTLTAQNATDVFSVRIEGTGESSNSLYLDELVFESLNKTYSKKVAVADNAEDGESVITFESSNSGNVPSAITTSLSSVGSSVRIAQMLDKNGNLGLALEVKSQSGGIDGLITSVTDRDNDKIVSIFEADIMITSASQTTMYQMFFEDSATGIAYMIELTKSGNNIVMKDYSHNQNAESNRVIGNPVTIGSFNKWFTIRIEMWHGSSSEIRFKTYIDDNLVYVSKNYFNCHTGSAPINSVAKVRINSLKSAVVSMCVDNVSFIQKNASEATYKNDDSLLQ